MKFTANAAGARRSTRRLMVSESADEAVIGAPNSARNTVSHVEQVRSSHMNGEVFGMASSLAKQQYTGYRSQSLIDLDSADKKSSAMNTVR